jgi:SAM-dependent methyltransferase
MNPMQSALKSLLNRRPDHANWQKIPWHEPEFSRRMLAEHVSQAHDLASRRLPTIDRHIQWIQRKILGDQPARILDLGCGPGFYTSRLAALGHACTGMDISPASIEYARAHDSASSYILGDVLTLDFGADYDLIMMLYGELNAFAPEAATGIIIRAHAALKPGGSLLLEASTYESIYRNCQGAASWYMTERGLFADEPYLCLNEARWDVDRAIDDMYVVLVESGEMQHYTTMHQAYTEDEYHALLTAFARVRIFPSLTGDVDNGNFWAIIADKAGG